MTTTLSFFNACYTVLAMTACGPPRPPIEHVVPGELARVPYESVCVTKGAMRPRGDAIVVDEPTVRAFAAGTNGDAAELAFVFGGDAPRMRALASGELRRQLGLKLRAANGCNVIYVMWRVDVPTLEVSVKHNPGKRTHDDCGAAGYTKVHPRRAAALAALAPGARHVLRAEIRGDDLIARVDGAVAWLGTLPRAARDLDGPAGFRSDNVVVELASFAAAALGDPRCRRSRAGDS